MKSSKQSANLVHFIESSNGLFVLIMGQCFNDQHIYYALNIITQIAFGYYIRNSTQINSICTVRYNLPNCSTIVILSEASQTDTHSLHDNFSKCTNEILTIKLANNKMNTFGERNRRH